MIPYGTLVVYVTPKGRRYVKKLEQDWHSNDGCLAASTVAESNFGAIVFTSENVPILVEEATLQDRLMSLKRQTQIIYPKDVAYICLRLGAGPGRLIAEAGCGSGSLTVALSWYCGPTGKVVSHDSREEFTRLARRNLDWAGVGENVELYARDIAEGFATENADAIFLDMREPWLYLQQILAAVKPGGTVAFLLPTANQIITLLLELEKYPFSKPEVCELAMRQWKPMPDRLRPSDRMIAHTGFLIFCRQQDKVTADYPSLPLGTRQRKEEAARRERLEKADIADSPFWKTQLIYSASDDGSMPDMNDQDPFKV